MKQRLIAVTVASASIFIVLAFQNCQGFRFDNPESSTSRSAMKSDTPSLNAAFAGDSSSLVAAPAERVSITFSDSIRHIWDQKLAAFQVPGDAKVFAFTRGYFDEVAGRFGIYLMESEDGLSFHQSGPALFQQLRSSWWLYDAHLAVDTSKSPALYIMTMECASPQFGASVCISTSTSPRDSTSWSSPRLIIENNGNHSASTGAVLVDQGRYFLKWTQVDDGTAPSASSSVPDEGFERTTTRAIELTSLTERHGNSDAGREPLGAEANVYCTSSWDCNNADVQDWKRIGNEYYAIYNGANYFRCVRPDIDRAQHTSQWAIAIRRSATPLGDYSASTGPIISSERNDTCGISYPVLNVINGQAYLYYTDIAASGEARFWRRPLNVSATLEIESSNLEDTRLQNYYLDLLGREATATEISHWVQRQRNEGMTPKQLAQGILFSEEFRARYQAADTPTRVEILYRGLLGRASDSGGRNTFVDLINSGASLEVVTNGFLDSEEFRNRH